MQLVQLLNLGAVVLHSPPPVSTSEDPLSALLTSTTPRQGEATATHPTPQQLAVHSLRPVARITSTMYSPVPPHQQQPPCHINSSNYM